MPVCGESMEDPFRVQVAWGGKYRYHANFHSADNQWATGGGDAVANFMFSFFHSFLSVTRQKRENICVGREPA